MSEIFSYLISPELQSRLWWLKVIFIILTLYFIFGIFYFGRKGKYFYDKGRRMRFWKDYKEEFSASKEHEKNWAKLEKYLKSKLSSDHKLAIVEAGKIFGDVLVASGSGQGSLEERVSRVIIDPNFNFEGLYKAHKLWERIIENPDQSIGLDEAKSTLAVYYQALVQLKYF